MKRAWFAVALLSGSWLLGLGYFDPPNVFAWACTLIAAVLLLAETPTRLPGLRQRIAALVLLLPTLWLVPLPYVGIVGLMSFGILVSFAPAPTAWLHRVGRGAILAGTMGLGGAF